MEAKRHGTSDEGLWADALARMTARIRATQNAALDGFPHYADPETGRWVTTADGFWTGGFWVGEFWLAGRYSGDESFHRAAEDWFSRLAARIESKSVFRGFLFLYGAVVGAELAGSAEARRISVAAARSLARAFDPIARLIPLGADAEEAHAVGNSESNIDGLIASPLLLWAARATSDAELRRIALAHADRNAEFCVQADGSVIQSASFDPAIGRLTRRYTHKGYSAVSVWSRAQAWAMLGFALSASRAPEADHLLAVADQVARWWVENVPDDRVAYWDFGALRTPETRKDTSGTAIAAALLKLATIHPDREKATGYWQAAEATLRELVRRHLTPVGIADPRPPGILADGCFDPKNGVAVANELIWGDYFLLESLLVLQGMIAPGQI